MKQVLFPGLNGIRFIAAFIVLIDHLELFKLYFGFESFWNEKYSYYLGDFGVSIFFVLSGFLITYLLLSEKRDFGDVSIKKFYIRRMLRIWPLYFIITLLGFFILPQIKLFEIPVFSSMVYDDFHPKLLLFTLFLSNVAYLIYPVVVYANVLWSVGVEEQFYLFWPWIVKLKKNYLKFFITFILVFVFVRTLSYKLATVEQLKSYSYYFSSLSSLLSLTRFPNMAIGAIGAYLLFFDKRDILKIIYSKASQYLVVVLFFVLFLDIIDFAYLSFLKKEFAAVLFCLIILNVSSNSNSIIKLNSRYIDFLGKISYGFYVYHSIMVVLVINIIKPWYTTIGASFYIWNVVLYVLSFLLTVIISWFSYELIEKYFLSWKLRYSDIKSGDTLELMPVDAVNVDENRYICATKRKDCR